MYTRTTESFYMASVRPKCGKDQKGIPPNVERYLLNERDLNDSQKERLTEWIITKREVYKVLGPL